MEKHAILNLAAAVLLVMNVLSFSLMGADKRRAKQGKWRIRERILLTASALFGALGGLLGMKCFHHKTLHKQFAVGIPVMLAVQLALLVWLCVRCFAA